MSKKVLARKPIRLFVSYSHKDGDLLEVFKDNLAVLEQDGFILSWTDCLLEASDDWDDVIKSQLSAAQMIVLLVSTAFLGSKYIRGVEMLQAVIRREKDEVDIVSVILEKTCAWNNERVLKCPSSGRSKKLNLARYQVLMSGDDAIRAASRPNDAFNVVQSAIQRLIERRWELKPKRVKRR